MSNRFYLDPAISHLEDECATLGGDEAYHFSRVMRGKPGDLIVLFDGIGHSWSAKVELIDKASVRLRLLETITDQIESPLRLTVASAMPKGDRQRFMVEKLAEIGVARLVPLGLDRSVARIGRGTAGKLQRYVVEAAKQCGRNVLMKITDEMSLAELTRLSNNQVRWILHPVSLGGVGQTTVKEILLAGLPEEAIILVGPEGSFTDREIHFALDAGFCPLDLGSRILRTETAAIAAAATLLTFAG